MCKNHTGSRGRRPDASVPHSSPFLWNRDLPLWRYAILDIYAINKLYFNLYFFKRAFSFNGIIIIIIKYWWNITWTPASCRRLRCSQCQCHLQDLRAWLWRRRRRNRPVRRRFWYPWAPSRCAGNEPSWSWPLPSGYPLFKGEERKLKNLNYNIIRIKYTNFSFLTRLFGYVSTEKDLVKYDIGEFP